MHFVLYSEKTVPQCLTAINERMQLKGTSTRPALDGWVEKSGAFSISMSAPVIGRFARRTVLKAKVEREGSLTVIRGSVPSGVTRQEQAVIFVALLLVALTIMGSGNVLVGALLIPLAAALYIPMNGDHLNSAILIDEVQKTLKARSKPPKPSAAEPKQAKASAVPAKPPKAAPPRPKPAKPATPRAAAPAKKESAPESEFPLFPDEPPP